MPSKLKVALVGAGSRSFGPASIRDVLLSDPLCGQDLELALMDIDRSALDHAEAYAHWVASELKREVKISSTTDLKTAIEGSRFVVDAIEISRDVYWAMDFHIPRKYGFKQIYGENGGPGSLFHALRNMKPILEIANAMSEVAPDAVLLNYTNPMHKLCEAVTRLTTVPVVGLCHGVWMGLGQLCALLELNKDEVEYSACGINHFTFFESIRLRSTGEDLYPRLREVERQIDPLYDWHEIGLARVLFRRFGLWPSPGANHTGEYIGWADEFYASNVLWYQDPMEGEPWQTGVAPEFCYTISSVRGDRPLRRPREQDAGIERGAIEYSNELAQPIMESLGCGIRNELDAVNIPNKGAIPGLPDDLVVEVPATADEHGWKSRPMKELPEGIAAMIRTQASIQKLLVEAYSEESKEKLLQAILLEPTVDSYRRAVMMMDELLVLQKDLLPPIH